ncbi:hypothetical protein QJS10_CPB12g00673 [Acorus calamus]|uniref:Uncharacterized protein n=1 Tax=Acorus calamus TaxID=4465 RepID=A0AAV9DN39_ACOCL|nr:hypothetical protein QJS10_CPB12g00673 [Acorus calamus]
MGDKEISWDEEHSFGFVDVEDNSPLADLFGFWFSSDGEDSTTPLTKIQSGCTRSTAESAVVESKSDRVIELQENSVGNNGPRLNTPLFEFAENVLPPSSIWADTSPNLELLVAEDVHMTETERHRLGVVFSDGLLKASATVGAMNEVVLKGQVVVDDLRTAIPVEERTSQSKI